MAPQHPGSDSSRSEAPSPTVRLTGDIDAAVRDEVADRLDAAAQDVAARGGVVIIDLTDVTFMDSTGLGCIVGCAAKVGPDGRVILQNAPRSVRRVLELADLDYLCDDVST